MSAQTEKKSTELPRLLKADGEIQRHYKQQNIDVTGFVYNTLWIVTLFPLQFATQGSKFHNVGHTDLLLNIAHVEQAILLEADVLLLLQTTPNLQVEEGVAKNPIK